MENAGRGAAESIDRAIDPNVAVTILCGKGNNAGDGYVIARHLELMRHPVRIVSVVSVEDLSGDAKTNAEIAQKSGIEIRCVDSAVSIDESIRGAVVLVDCLLGTGAEGAPRGLYADAIGAANECEALRIAVDVPSGLDMETGSPHDPTFKADRTLTFVGEKTAFHSASAKPFVGHVEVIPIGIPRSLLETFC